jgi:hypothetical protein
LNLPSCEASFAGTDQAKRSLIQQHSQVSSPPRAPAISGRALR